jgi:hypothetical protein
VTCKRTFRSLLLSAALTLSVGVAGVAAAGPTVGGTLSAEGHNISVFSNGNVPAHIHMTASDVVLSESDFDLQPGETHHLTFSGPKATGDVTALYTTVAVTESGETGSAALNLRLTPGVPPPPSPVLPVGLSLLLLIGLLLLLRRTRPWRYRLSLTRAQ